ncbi:MAG: hypothetical protein LBC27_02030 [Spirochaetaceae bacterium]|nr:hypothetical protein [Spirochaetaceae bacterium]
MKTALSAIIKQDGVSGFLRDHPSGDFSAGRQNSSPNCFVLQSLARRKHRRGCDVKARCTLYAGEFPGPSSARGESPVYV